ncbi:unnamed protein product [Mytilus edulis]|uniref:SGNH hydrolase-type esterase domain-containing protein n=1 Tax=Mytilus edulis TaxID=6550 RepID=A0A8S3S1B2_MYTED|nr:unnamed protein product [Mytilus edulis]
MGCTLTSHEVSSKKGKLNHQLDFTIAAFNWSQRNPKLQTLKSWQIVQKGRNSPHKDGHINFSKSSNQASFKLNKDSVLVWRRALLTRYFIDLWNETKADVKWTDHDEKSRVVTINDEKQKENNKVEEESIVKEVNITNSNHIQQSQINSLNKTNDDLIQEPEVGKTSTCINIDDQDNTSNKDDGKDENSLEGVLKKMELQENEIKTLKSAFHKLENEHIVRDEKINNLTIMCEKIITKFEDIDQIKSEVHKINQSVEKLDFASTNENYKENKAQNLLNNSKLAENYKEIQRVKDQENSGLKQLENSTKEMKENILEEINRHFMDLRIGVNTNFKTLERIQEVNKTCSEMKDLFKARCTQSVTQSDNNTQSMIEKESGNSIEKSKNTNIQKVDLWVIGSSIVKDLDGKKMYKNKQVKITTLRDKTVEGATKFVKLGTVHAKNVLLQIGSNDLEQKTPDDVLQEVELLVRELKSTLPESTVVIGELLPRYYLGDRNKADAYNEKIGLYNILLRDYCVDTGLHYVQFENMIHSDFYDGIHPNFKGVKALCQMC